MFGLGKQMGKSVGFLENVIGIIRGFRNG